MKVDGLGIVLSIILLPIIIVVTYYVQMQVDTIATENSYNTQLLNATYDAMSAFEINTANEELSSVADSMRSIVLASNNIFLNTLATNLGISNASKESLQPYIPAVLYTMYDGYYIYAPTETPKVAEKTETDTTTGLITTKGYISVGDEGTDGLGGTYGDIVYEKEDGSYTINKNEAKQDTDYILKSYVQYSARYQKDNPETNGKDVTINYTLDNYLNIVGKIKGVYYTKTGYLIKDGLVTTATINGNPYDLDSNNEDDAKNRILGLKTNALETTIKAENASVEVNGVEIKSNFSEIKKMVEQNFPIVIGSPIEIFTVSEAETSLEKFYEKYESINDGWFHNDSLLTLIQEIEYEIQNCKAVAYYISSACFSNWVYENLGDLTSGDIQDEAMTKYYGEPNRYQTSSGVNDLYYDFSLNPTPIFIDSEHPDPEDTESNFNTHKMEVIKNSIKYNLNLSMSAYNNIYTQYEASMPVLLDEEWDKILSNISIVSFMQGWDCGLNIYNNYQIVSSTNNELTVTPSEIYFVKKDEFNNGNGSYHRIDCPYLEDGDYISFKSKEVKYDKVYDKSSGQYKFDHKNLACYTCINTNNYESLFKPKTDTDYYKDGKKYTSFYDRVNSLESETKKKAAYIGLAKERQDIYKTNALPVSEGYKIFDNNNVGWSSDSSGNTQINGINLLELSELQLTVEVNTNQTKPTDNGSIQQILTLNISDDSGNTDKLDIRLTQSIPQTIVVNVSDWTGTMINMKPEPALNNYQIKYTVKSVKAIYK